MIKRHYLPNELESARNKLHRAELFRQYLRTIIPSDDSQKVLVISHWAFTIMLTRIPSERNPEDEYGAGLNLENCQMVPIDAYLDLELLE